MLKQKVEGISLIVALGASLLVLAMGIGIITSVEKSHQRSIDIENSIQFFYGSESAIEAALFHKKARGKGAHFGSDTSEAQKLTFYHDTTLGKGAMETKWKLNGRAGTAGNPIIGMLKEGEAVEVPLFWDAAATPDLPKAIQSFGSGDRYTLKFYTLTDQMDGSPTQVGTDEYKFVQKYGNIDERIVFDTATEDDTVVIDWDMTRIATGIASQTFAVAENSERKYCTGTIESDPDPNAQPAHKTHNFCKTSFNNMNITMVSNDDIQGKINHRLKDPTTDTYWTLDEFTDFGSSSFEEFQLSFNSGFVQYEGTNGKFRGIPYTLKTNNRDVPKPYYQIVAEVDNANKFNQRLEIELKEVVANKNFRYVIFD